MHSWDQMKPRTVYDKAVHDLTYTARQLARLDQNFCRASFEEFKLLMGLDAEAQKRYGLPPPRCTKRLCSVSTDTGPLLMAAPATAIEAPSARPSPAGNCQQRVARMAPGPSIALNLLVIST
jgi:hypothetical protein